MARGWSCVTRRAIVGRGKWSRVAAWRLPPGPSNCGEPCISGWRWLRAAGEAAAARGANTLFLEVARSNTAAQALYAGQGFAPVGVRRRYYADGGDAMILRSILPPD